MKRRPTPAPGAYVKEFRGTIFELDVLYFQHAQFIPVIVGVGKARCTLMVHGDLQNGNIRYWNYLEDYWPFAGRL